MLSRAARAGRFPLLVSSFTGSRLGVGVCLVVSVLTVDRGFAEGAGGDTHGEQESGCELHVSGLAEM